MKIEITREELLMLIDAANRVGHRKDEIYEIDFAQIELVSLRKRKPRDPVDAEPSRRLIKPKRDDTTPLPEYLLRKDRF